MLNIFCSVVEASLEMFAAFCDGDTTAIHPNIRSPVFAVALTRRGRPAYEKLLSYFRHAKNPDEMQAALEGMGNTNDPSCVQKVLNLILTDEIKTQDVIRSY